MRYMHYVHVHVSPSDLPWPTFFVRRMQHDDLGRPLPQINADHVHVYTSNLQLSLDSSEMDHSNVQTCTFLEPLLPGPPLRGYAAAPLAPSEPRRVADAQYQQMMQSILNRTRVQNQAQQQDEDRRVERMLKHIEKEQEFVEQLNASLEIRERAKLRRQTQLYREWKEKVYETIQAQIDQQLASIRTEDISMRRRGLMEDYIRVSNQKRYGLYRDIIIESEYDPLVAHKTLLKYTMSNQTDPLKLEVNNAEIGKPKRELGAKAAASGVTATDACRASVANCPPTRCLATLCTGRATLSAITWDKLHSTPYGRFDRIQPPATDQSPYVSRVNFSHYDISHDPEVLSREFARGKRIYCDAPQREQRSAPWE